MISWTATIVFRHTYDFFNPCVLFLFSASQDNEFNSQSDCFVCAILTHGEEGVVFGVDDKIETKQLLEFFKGNNCKGLVGKPKIFFIQVRCQER